MTSPQQLYKQFLLKVNKNDTNSNINIPKAQFALLYNEQLRSWFEDKIKQNENSDYIEEIEELLITDKQLTKESTLSTKDVFTQPSDFGRRVSGYITATKGECKNSPLVTWFKKPKDLQVALQNSNEKPSFEYQETIAVLNKGKVDVYKDDFAINEYYLTYYKLPDELDIKGYKHFDGSESVDKLPDLSIQNLEDVLNVTALEAVRNYQSIEQTQLAASRLQQKQ